jgi:hypothetical protein
MIKNGFTELKNTIIMTKEGDRMESLEELLQIDTDSNKAQENKNLLKEIKQLLKKQTKKETNLDKKAEDMPYEGVAVVGNRFVTLKFNLETREAVVADVEVDTRDTGKQNHMATFVARNKLERIARATKGDNGDE